MSARTLADGTAWGAAARAGRGPSLAGAMAYGALGFAAVSVLAYSLWAFRLVRGEGPLYAAIAVVYVACGGLVLSRLIPLPGAWRRFPPVFALGFAVYAVVWCALWFGLRGKYLADLWGAALGLAGLVWLWRRAFGVSRGFWPMLLGLLLLHSAGYYLGGELMSRFARPTGPLLWGAAHGLGFGAGLGWVLHQVQAAWRARTSAA